jgi:hypothetical protein
MKKYVSDKKPRKKDLDSLLIGEYEKEITYTCPTRGEVTQKVTVKQYKSIAVEPRFIIGVEDTFGDLDVPISETHAVEEEIVAVDDDVEPTEVLPIEEE